MRPASTSGTHIGQTVRVQGELIGSEDLIIDGTVEGRVVLMDNSLTVGKDGNVRAELWAKSIKIVGRVVGDVHATDRIEVAEGGSVEGDLLAPKVVLAEGSLFKGRIDMQVEMTSPPSAGSSMSTAFGESADLASDFGPDVDASQVDPWADPGDEIRGEATRTPDAKAEAKSGAKGEKAKAGARDKSGSKQVATAEEPTEQQSSKLASVMSDFDPSNP